MPLNKLPDELIPYVLHQLKAPKDLSSLALCCHRFHHIVLPILYSCFTEDGRQNTPAFLVTILDRPDLARYVKRYTSYSLDIAWIPPSALGFYSYCTKIRTILEEVFAGYQDGTVGSDKSLKDKWYDGLYSWENWDAVSAFVLLLLPNITALNLPVCPRHSYKDISWYIPHISLTPPGSKVPTPDHHTPFRICKA
jgi:hypothetical protein